LSYGGWEPLPNVALGRVHNDRRSRRHSDANGQLEVAPSSPGHPGRDRRSVRVGPEEPCAMLEGTRWP